MYASSWATPTSESTTADVRPAVTKIFGQSPQGIVRYASASSVAYSTATEAASVAVNTPARIPPRMMMGAPSGGNAASPARTSPEGVTATRSPVGSLYLAYRKMTRPLASPTTNAGISEARNRSRMDRLATVPRMIIVVIGGIIVDPIAAASALTEPDRPENSIVEATTLMPSPPGSQPTSIVTKRTNRSAAPERCRISPVRMNIGIARNVNESMPWKTACAEADSGRPSAVAWPMPTAPSEATTGDRRCRHALPTRLVRHRHHQARHLGTPQQGDDLDDHVYSAERPTERQREKHRPQWYPGRRDDVTLFVRMNRATDADGAQHAAEVEQLDDAQHAPGAYAEPALEQVQRDVRVVPDPDGEAHERDVHEQVGGDLGGPGQGLRQHVPEEDLRQDGQRRAREQHRDQGVLGEGEPSQQGVGGPAAGHR